MHTIVYIDGGARGNPGPAAAGVVIRDAATRKVIHEAGYFLGRATNNVAEYRGLIRALELLGEIGATRADIYSDSQLMVQQVNGRWKIKTPHLRPLADRAKELLAPLDQWRLTHVRREANARADALANASMDAGGDVVRVPRDG